MGRGHLVPTVEVGKFISNHHHETLHQNLPPLLTKYYQHSIHLCRDRRHTFHHIPAPLSLSKPNNHPSKCQIKEIALGFKKSDKRFLWVVRNPIGYEREELSSEELFPLGFLKRTKEKGKVVKDWAPQMNVLSHDSIGAFVTHCGWNQGRISSETHRCHCTP